MAAAIADARAAVADILESGRLEVTIASSTEGGTREGHLQLLREAEGSALVQRDPHLARVARRRSASGRTAR